MAEKLLSCSYIYIVAPKALNYIYGYLMIIVIFIKFYNQSLLCVLNALH